MTDNHNLPIIINEVVALPDQDKSVELLAIADGEYTTFPVSTDVLKHRRGDTILGAAATLGADVRLVPAVGERYTDEEAATAKELGQPAAFINNPNEHQKNENELYVVDATSPKAVLDLAIRAGYGTTELRKMRRAYSHGEKPEGGEVLDLVTGYLKKMADPDRQKAEKWSEAIGSLWGAHTPLSQEGFVEEVARSGLDAFSLRKMQDLLDHGFKPAVFEMFVENPKAAKELAAKAWQSAVKIAAKLNPSAHGDGAYTELHMVAGVLVPVLSMGKATEERIDLYSGHTLTGIYKYGAQDDYKHIYGKSEVFDNKLVELSNALGLGELWNRSLLRRCLTVIDDSDRATVRLQKEKYPSSKSPSEEWLTARLQEAGIDGAVQQDDMSYKSVERGEADDGSVEVVINDVLVSEEGQKSSNGYIAVLDTIKQAEDGMYEVVWAGGDGDLLHNEISTHIGQTRGGKQLLKVAGRTFSIMAREFNVGDESEITWIVKGSQNHFDAAKEDFIKIAKISNKAFSDKLGRRVTSFIAFRNGNQELYTEIEVE